MTMQDGLNDFLEREIAARTKLKAVDRKGKESFMNPQVIRSGWILPSSIDDDRAEDGEFPYIITRIEKVESVKGARHSVVTMLILIGVYDSGVYDGDGLLVKDGSGYRDLWNLLEATRQAIFSQHTIDNKYRVHDDFYEAEPLKDQEYPYWQGYCRLKFDVVFVAPNLDEFFSRKGD